MQSKEKIIKIINEMSGRYSPENIFSDWIHCMAISIQNACYLLENKIYQKREEEYLAIIKKYTHNEQMNMCEMSALLTEEFDQRMSDILGEIYMESGCGSKAAGQFFTPYHVSKLTAKAVIPADVSEQNKMVINEPSAGSGGMIIAMAECLKEKGLNYQKCMKVTAQDIDWRSVYMSYVQFSLLGLNAVVIQCNTLENKRVTEEHILRTPVAMGVLL